MGTEFEIKNLLFAVILSASAYLCFAMFGTIIFECKEYGKLYSLKIIREFEVGLEKIIEDNVNKLRSIICYMTLCMILIFLSLLIYYYFAVKYSYLNVFSSGIVLPPLLMITGYLINFSNDLILDKFRNLKKLHKSDSKVIMLTTTVLCAMIVNYKSVGLCLTIVAIIIGKFVWIDTSFKDVLNEIIQIKNGVSSVTGKILFMYLVTMFIVFILCYLKFHIAFIVIAFLGVNSFNGIYVLKNTVKQEGKGLNSI